MADAPPADVPAADVPAADVPAADVPAADAPAADAPPAGAPAKAPRKKRTAQAAGLVAAAGKDCERSGARVRVPARAVTFQRKLAALKSQVPSLQIAHPDAPVTDPGTREAPAPHVRALLRPEHLYAGTAVPCVVFRNRDGSYTADSLAAPLPTLQGLANTERAAVADFEKKCQAAVTDLLTSQHAVWDFATAAASAALRPSKEDLAAHALRVGVADLVDISFRFATLFA